MTPLRLFILILLWLAPARFEILPPYCSTPLTRAHTRSERANARKRRSHSSQISCAAAKITAIPLPKKEPVCDDEPDGGKTGEESDHGCEARVGRGPLSSRSRKDAAWRSVSRYPGGAGWVPEETMIGVGDLARLCVCARGELGCCAWEWGCDEEVRDAVLEELCGTREVVEEEALCDFYGDDEDGALITKYTYLGPVPCLSRSPARRSALVRGPENFWLERRFASDAECLKVVRRLHLQRSN